MKKNELKKLLKPLIKECIKEVIFEEGSLSTIISEVIRGTSQVQPIVERKSNRNQKEKMQHKLEEQKQKRKKMLDAIGKDAYNGVNLFEGTTPTAAPSTTQGQGPLDGVDPRDPGVDISSIFSGHSSNIWKKLSGK